MLEVLLLVVWARARDRPGVIIAFLVMGWRWEGDDGEAEEGRAGMVSVRRWPCILRSSSDHRLSSYMLGPWWRRVRCVGVRGDRWGGSCWGRGGGDGSDGRGGKGGSNGSGGSGGGSSGSGGSDGNDGSGGSGGGSGGSGGNDGSADVRGGGEMVGLVATTGLIHCSRGSGGGVDGMVRGLRLRRFALLRRRSVWRG